MSYDIRFCVQTVQPNKDGECFAVVHRPEYDSPTYNYFTMFRACMDWDYDETKIGEDGYRHSCYYPVPEVLPKLHHGLKELTEHPERYRQYEPSNGWGTIDGAIKCIRSWIRELEEDSWDGPTYLWPIEALWWRW